MGIVKWNRTGLRALLVLPALLLVGPPAAAQGGDALVILPNGNVGIGKAEPDARLDVDGDVRAGELRLSGVARAPNILAWSAKPLTAASTLPAQAVGSMHRVSGGDGAGFAITLPSAQGRAGQVIGFAVASYETSPYAYTLVPAQAVVAAPADAQPPGSAAVPAAQETIDGRLRLVLIHGNTLVLMSDGAGWISVARQLDTPWVTAAPRPVQCVPAERCTAAAAPSHDVLRWRRRGDSMELTWEYAGTVAGPFVPGLRAPIALALPLPAGTQVQLDKLTAAPRDALAGGRWRSPGAPATPLGFGEITDGGSMADLLAVIAVATDPPVIMAAGRYRDPPNFSPPSSDNPPNASYRLTLSVRATVPIQDW